MLMLFNKKSFSPIDFVVIASNNYDNYASGKEKNKQVKVNRIPIQTNFS